MAAVVQLGFCVYIANGLQHLKWVPWSILNGKPAARKCFLLDRQINVAVQTAFRRWPRELIIHEIPRTLLNKYEKYFNLLESCPPETWWRVSAESIARGHEWWSAAILGTTEASWTPHRHKQRYFHVPGYSDLRLILNPDFENKPLRKKWCIEFCMALGPRTKVFWLETGTNLWLWASGPHLIFSSTLRALVLPANVAWY